MKIRKFRKEDARKASDVIRKALREVNINDYSKKGIEILVKKQSPSKLIERAKSGDFYVAIEGEKILGIGGMVETEVNTVFVNPKHHSKGIGKELMRYIENEAKKKNIKRLWLNSSLTAEKFYKMLGYKRIKKEKYEISGIKLYGIIMEKSL